MAQNRLVVKALTPQTPDAPVRAGRGIVTRGEAKSMAVNEMIRREEAKKANV